MASKTRIFDNQIRSEEGLCFFRRPLAPRRGREAREAASRSRPRRHPWAWMNHITFNPRSRKQTIVTDVSAFRLAPRDHRWEGSSSLGTILEESVGRL